MGDDNMPGGMQLTGDVSVGHGYHLGEVEHLRLVGTPHVKCSCGAVSLDLEDAMTVAS